MLSRLAASRRAAGRRDAGGREGGGGPLTTRHEGRTGGPAAPARLSAGGKLAVARQYRLGLGPFWPGSVRLRLQTGDRNFRAETAPAGFRGLECDGPPLVGPDPIVRTGPSAVADRSRYAVLCSRNVLEIQESHLPVRSSGCTSTDRRP